MPPLEGYNQLIHLFLSETNRLSPNGAQSNFTRALLVPRWYFGETQTQEEDSALLRWPRLVPLSSMRCLSVVQQNPLSSTNLVTKLLDFYQNIPRLTIRNKSSSEEAIWTHLKTLQTNKPFIPNKTSQKPSINLSSQIKHLKSPQTEMFCPGFQEPDKYNLFQAIFNTKLHFPDLKWLYLRSCSSSA